MEFSNKVGRMCAMNLSLHGIGGDKVVVHSGHDSLAAPWSKEYTMILANPPFGKSQSLLFVNEEIPKRDKLSLDLFWIKDKSLTDTDALPAPDIIATEIADELETAFDLFTKIAKKLPKSVGRNRSPT